MYVFNAELVRVIDGDTIVFNIDLGFDIWIHKEHVRLARINCPETRTLDLNEKRKGLEAKAFVSEVVEDCLNSGGKIVLSTFKDSGKFGRYIAYVILEDKNANQVNLNSLIVENNHGVYVDY